MPRRVLPEGDDLIDEVLVDSGQYPLRLRSEDAFREIAVRAERVLEAADLGNVVVVRAGGKFVVGSFEFVLRVVTMEDVRRVLQEVENDEA